MKHSNLNRYLSALLKISIVAVYYMLMLVKGYSVLSEQWQSYGLLAVGLALGLLATFLDAQYLFRYYQDTASVNPTHLATRSTLFLLALVPLSLFVLTSTGSPLGVGLVVGLVSSVMIDMCLNARRPEAFADQFLYQIKRNFTPRQVLVVAGCSVVWLLILWFLSFTN